MRFAARRACLALLVAFWACRLGSALAQGDQALPRPWPRDPNLAAMLHKPFRERQEAVFEQFLGSDSIYNYDSTVALPLLDGVWRQAQKAGDHSLAQEIELLRLSYHRFGRVAPDTARLLREGHAMLADARRRGEAAFEARIRLELASFHDGREDYLRSFQLIYPVYELVAPLPLASVPDKKYLLYSNALAYYRFGDYATAKRVLLQADGLPGPGPLISAYVRNTLGLIERAAGNYLQALAWFRGGVPAARAAGDTTWVRILQGNIGSVYYLQGRFADALPLMDSDRAQSYVSQKWDNGVAAAARMAHIYIQRGHLAAASAVLLEARRAYGQSERPAETGRKLYEMLGRLAAAQGQYKLAYAYGDTARQAGIAEARRRNGTYLLAAAAERIRLLAEAEKARQATATRLRVGGLLLTLALGLIAGAALFVRQRRRFLSRRTLIEAERAQALAERAQALAATQQAEQELDAVTSDLEEARRALADFTRQMQMKNEEMARQHAAATEARAPALAQGNGHALQATNPDSEAALQALQRKALVRPEDWAAFKGLFDAVHPGFAHRALARCPALSPTELRLLMVMRLQMSPREAASVLGVGPEAVRVGRHRLRKRLQLGIDEGLEGWIEAL